VKKQIICKKAPSAVGPYSQAIAVNGMLFVSGQLPISPDTGEVSKGIAEQTRQTLENVKSIVEEAGGTMDNVVKCSVFLTNFEEFAEMNEVYKEFFKEPYPARVTVEITKFPRGIKIEIDAIAVI
jgi:2-iminobutanoate/2-iminopropanoate deaminase